MFTCITVCYDEPFSISKETLIFYDSMWEARGNAFEEAERLCALHSDFTISFKAIRYTDKISIICSRKDKPDENVAEIFIRAITYES